MGSALEIETPSGRRWVPFGELQDLAREGRIPVGALVEGEVDATHVTFESSEGDYRASIPLGVVCQQGVLILEPSGGLRLVVEGGETLCWNVKRLRRIRLTEGKEPDSVPENPRH